MSVGVLRPVAKTRCTLPVGYGVVCGLPKSAPCHVAPDQRMYASRGEHLWRHEQTKRERVR